MRDDHVSRDGTQYRDGGTQYRNAASIRERADGGN
jgi:hypothetical protein